MPPVATSSSAPLHLFIPVFMVVAARFAAGRRRAVGTCTPGTTHGRTCAAAQLRRTNLLDLGKGWRIALFTSSGSTTTPSTPSSASPAG
jgi:hypothetical protein